MSSILLAIPQVVFRPYEEVIIPTSLQNNTSLGFTEFPVIPSAKYYYLDSQGNKIPTSNTVGTIEERLVAIQAWYAMKSDTIFPLITTYAKARNDQIGRSGDNLPESTIALSMKGQIRQVYDANDWLHLPRFQLLISQTKGVSIQEFIGDIYRFPLNPSVDSFKVARLLEIYIKDGDELPIRKYLANRGITHLVDHSLKYYPIYYLFFLLTRLASYPLNQEQIQLSTRRSRTYFQSPERIFIDAIFQYNIYNIDEVLQIIDQIAQQGPESAGMLFGTQNPDWVRWADEYLINKGKPSVGIENLADVGNIVAEKLYTWSDIEIQGLCDRYQMLPPFTSEYPTRYSYVADIAVKIQRFKADPVGASLWKQQVVEADGY